MTLKPADCPIEGCDLPFPHLPDGPEHRPDCGCEYNSAGNFTLCAVHVETGYIMDLPDTEVITERV